MNTPLRTRRAKILILTGLLLTLVTGTVQAAGLRLHVDAEGVPGNPVEVFAWDASSPAPFTAVLTSPSGKKLVSAASFTLLLRPGRVLQAALLPLDSQLEPGAYSVSLQVLGKKLGPFLVAVKDRTWVSEDIPLDPVNTKLRSQPDPRQAKEAEEIWKLYATVNPGSVFDYGRFSLPLAGKLDESAFFGDRRRFLYSNGKKDVSTHNGLDYAGTRGTPVMAGATGRVVLAKPRILTGNTVVLEHLPGVYTVHFHLDRIDVAPGDLALRGQVIGTLGHTGLSTAPHLHWEFRVGAVPQEPKTFLAYGLLDKERLNRIIDSTH